MSWLQFRLETRAEFVPHCEEALLALGAAAVTLEDGADEPLFAQADHAECIWQQTRITGLFPADTNVDSLWRALPDALREECRYRAEILENKDWEREWMRHYQPRQFADTSNNGHVPRAPCGYGAWGFTDNRLRLRLGHSRDSRSQARRRPCGRYRYRPAGADSHGGQRET